MGDSLDPSGDPSLESQNVAIVDYTSFTNYLRKAVMILLPDEDVVPPGLNLALEDENNQKCIRKFLSQSQVWSLFIQRSSSREKNDMEGAKEEASTLYYISNEIYFANPKMASLVLTKRKAIVGVDKSIHSQLRLVTFSDGPPYETLHAISKTMAPYFKSYAQGTGRAVRDCDKMAPLVEKKIAELEMGLLHLQQNIDIPEISLLVHPLVSLIIKQCGEEGRKPKLADIGEKVEDSTFLNQLQNGVNRWIKEIRKVTKLNRDPESGTALQEISFWLDWERALHRIQEERESIEISLTLDILKHGKRFHATVSFDTDTGLKQALATVNDYNTLMKNFPINDLLSATDLERIKVAVQQILLHLRKIRNTMYPTQRFACLIKAISRDLEQQLLKVLGTRRLMHIAFDEFEKVMGQCFEVFTTWDNEYHKLQTGLQGDIAIKKREDDFMMLCYVSSMHERLQARMEHMRKFRHQHEQLRTIIVHVMRLTLRQNRTNESVKNTDIHSAIVKTSLDSLDANVISELNLAYEDVQEVDWRNLTEKGLESWEAAVHRYEKRIERIEARIIAHLRDHLGAAKNTNEMFKIFSQFNVLFARPHTCGAFREYQSRLIQCVKNDIEALHERFKVQYSQSKCCRMSMVRDLPPVAGSIIWVKQIDYQLTKYLKRVEDVLGKCWENHIEGQKLKADGDSFRMKLSTQDIFDDWARKVQPTNIGMTGRIFTIDSVRSRSGRGNVLKLKVNFLPESITLAKEVRNLTNLGFRVPLAIVSKAHQADQLYPFAISLIESIRTYERTVEKIEDKTSITWDQYSIVPLVADIQVDIQSLISEGICMVWESNKLESYTKQLAEVIVSFQKNVEHLSEVRKQLNVDVRSIETCPYSTETFAYILSEIQQSVDGLSLENYSNLRIWTARLNEEVEKNLAVRLEAGIKAWTHTLMGQKEEVDVNMDTDAPVQPTHKPGGSPKIQHQIHEVRITNQTMYLYPSIEDARFQIMQQLFAWQATVTSQLRLCRLRYQVGSDKPEPRTYRSLLTELPAGEIPLEAAYEAIEVKMKDIANYVDQWLRYQSLWDLQPNNLWGKLGDSINLWMKCLKDMKNMRTSFETLDTRKDFGPVIIDFVQAHRKVLLKYDSWHKETLEKLGSLLGDELSIFPTQISKSKNDLEQQSIETASTADPVGFVTYIQSHHQNIKVWEKQVEVCREGQRILERQRFEFPSTWPQVDNIEKEWRVLEKIIEQDSHRNKDN